MAIGSIKEKLTSSEFSTGLGWIWLLILGMNFTCLPSSSVETSGLNPLGLKKEYVFEMPYRK